MTTPLTDCEKEEPGQPLKPRELVMDDDLKAVAKRGAAAREAQVDRSSQLISSGKQRWQQKPRLSWARTP